MPTLDQILIKIEKMLQDSVSTRNHPFRYCTLATIADAQPKQRMVVLREVVEICSLLFYTDTRSSKIEQIQLNPAASVLCYDPVQQIQLTLEGTIEIITQGSVFEEKKKSITVDAKKDYSTHLSPGTPIETLEQLTYNLEDSDHFYFGILKFTPLTIKYLKINTTAHHSAVFKQIDTQWKGSFTIP